MIGNRYVFSVENIRLALFKWTIKKIPLLFFLLLVVIFNYFFIFCFDYLLLFYCFFLLLFLSLQYYFIFFTIDFDRIKGDGMEAKWSS